MYRKGFTIVEVIVVFLLILTVAFFVIPKSLDTTKQARFISQWTQKYSELEYMFSVIKAQNEGSLAVAKKNLENDKTKDRALLSIIKPYLRITSSFSSPNYKPRYMNRAIVKEHDTYYFDNFYKTSSNEIIGLQKYNKDCTEKTVCTVISFDMNGENKPNAWGYDIFGINVFKNQIEPIGKHIDNDTLKRNCSSDNFGTFCSYYYLIGGKFE